MENIRFIITNHHDSAYVTATTEALPAAYTQRSERVRTWRSTDASEQVITASLASAAFLEGIVLYRHNLSSSARVRVEVLNGEDVAYDSGEVNVSGLIPLGEFRFGVDPWGATSTGDLPIKQAPFWFRSMAATDYRITINDPDNTDGYIEIGRIIAGPVISPKYNPPYGLQLEWQDFAEHRRTEGMSLRTTGEGIARSLPVDLNFMDRYDREALSSAFLRNGKRSDIYVSVYPEQGGFGEGEHAFLARRENNFAHTHDFFGNWKTQIALVEV